MMEVITKELLDRYRSAILTVLSESYEEENDAESILLGAAYEAMKRITKEFEKLRKNNADSQEFSSEEVFIARIKALESQLEDAKLFYKLFFSDNNESTHH